MVENEPDPEKMKKLKPRDCSVYELEQFLITHRCPLPEVEKRNTTMHVQKLVALAELTLRQQNREFIEFKSTGIKKLMGTVVKKVRGKSGQNVDYQSSEATVSTYTSDEVTSDEPIYDAISDLDSETPLIRSTHPHVMLNHKPTILHPHNFDSPIQMVTQVPRAQLPPAQENMLSACNNNITRESPIPRVRREAYNQEFSKTHLVDPFPSRSYPTRPSNLPPPPPSMLQPQQAMSGRVINNHTQFDTQFESAFEHSSDQTAPGFNAQNKVNAQNGVQGVNHDPPHQHFFQSTPVVPTQFHQPNNAELKKVTFQNPTSTKSEESFRVNNTVPQSDKPFRSKFMTKFCERTVNIETYVSAVDRWRKSNNVSVESAVSVALGNFSNLELSNHIANSLTPQAYSDFDSFRAQMKQHLGKTTNEWYDIFDSATRMSSETTFVYFARLQNTLKLSLNITSLSDEHKRVVSRKFLKTIHPTLRSHLEARDTMPSFEELPQVAGRIETALKLPKGSVATVNAINAQLKCDLCKKPGHTLTQCWGNPLNDNFDLEKFRKLLHIPSKNSKN